MSEQQDQKIGEALDTKTEISETEVKEIVGQIMALDAKTPSELDFDIDAQGPWSSSKLKCLVKCPFQYYLKYILKFKLPSHYQIQDDPYSANRGKAAHEILEHVIIGKSVEDSYKKVRTKYIGTKTLTEEQWEVGVAPLEYNITRFRERIETVGRNHPIRRALTELRIGVTRDFEPTGFFADNVWYRGVVDLVLMLENKDVLIIDHKTGGGFGGVKAYEEQLDVYKFLFYFGIEKVAGAQSGVHFIEAGDVIMAQYSTAEQIESELRDKLLWSLNGGIDKAKELGFFKHVRGNQCKWCPFDSLGCKAGLLKPLELSTKRFFEIKKA